MSGLVLGMALMGKYMVMKRVEQKEVEIDGAQENGKDDSRKQWLAKGLASWIRYSYGAGKLNMGQEDSVEEASMGEVVASWLGRQSPLVCFYELYQNMEEQEMESDPSYTRYMDRQRVMKESAYLYLFGDENSGIQEAEILTEEGMGDVQIAQNSLKKT